MKVKQVIELALGHLGVLAEGEEAQPETIADALLYLNGMLGNWSTKNLVVPIVSRESFNLPAQQEITMMPSGDLDTVCPAAIKGMTISDSAGAVYKVIWATEEKIRGLSTLSNETVPSSYHFMPDTCKIIFSSIPPSGCTIKIRSYKAFDEFDELTENMAFPSGYEFAIQFNLEQYMAKKFGKTLDTNTITQARELLRDLKARNAADRGPGLLEMPAGTPGMKNNSKYNITQG